VDRGALVVSYVGHGNVGLWGSWAGGRIFETSTIARLNNGPRLPLMTVIGCLNGFFAHPEIGSSLAEEWVRAPGRGGVAAWAPAALGYLYPETELLGAFYRALFAGPGVPLGAATTEAAILALGSGAITPDLAQTYVLLGDPALALNVPWRLHRVYLAEIRRGSRN